MILRFLNKLNRKDGFLNYRTSKYKLHFYETPSGLKFVMNTDLNVGNIRDIMHQLYHSVSISHSIPETLVKITQFFVF